MANINHCPASQPSWIDCVVAKGRRESTGAGILVSGAAHRELEKRQPE